MTELHRIEEELHRIYAQLDVLSEELRGNFPQTALRAPERR